VAGVLLVAACSEPLSPPAPVTDADIPLTAARAAIGTPDGRFLVTFDKAVPQKFEERVAEFGGTVDYSHPIGLAVVSGISADAAQDLAGDLGVQAVVPDFAQQMDPVVGMSVEAAQAGVASPDDPTSAFVYARQWNMRAVDADQAWARGRLGIPQVTVAILDTGIDYTYPDLQGLVDLSRSVSFVASDDALVQQFFPGAHPIADLRFHGTHVAATVSSNGVVAAGVTSKTTLMGVKVCDVNGSCPFSSIMLGILHAVDNGAQVINMSLGGSFPRQAGNDAGVTELIELVFNYAYDQRVAIVVSAGNSAEDMDAGNRAGIYYSYCDAYEVICVSATAPPSGGTDGPWPNADDPASYTNTGKRHIWVAAPGGDTGAAVWAACTTFSLVIPQCQTGVFVVGLGGTSMSAPHVSGTAALMVADFWKNPDRLQNTLKRRADDLGPAGRDDFYGWGRINVNNTVK